MTVDKPSGLSPNRRDISYRHDFGGAYTQHALTGPPKLIGIPRRNWRSPLLYQERYESIHRFEPSQEKAITR
jgi:hypothetical protein